MASGLDPLPIDPRVHALGPTPRVSVILPVRNEAAFIARCLGAILDQTYPADLIEVLVADGMSDDSTRELIASLPGHERVRVLDNPERLQAAGANLCIAQARGDVIVRIDGHTIVARDYVERCVATLRETGAWNVGGAITGAWTTETGRAIAAAGTSQFAVPGAFHGGLRACDTDTVYLGAWPAAVLRTVGGYRADLAINEDYELNHRIRTAGGRVRYDPQIRCAYYGRQTFSDLARQYYRYGRGKVEVLVSHPGSLKVRHTVAPGFVAALVACLALAPWCGAMGLAGLGILTAYQILNAAFGLRTALRQGTLRLAPRISLAFWTMHLAWGAGFWVGVGRLLRWGTAGRRASPVGQEPPT